MKCARYRPIYITNGWTWAISVKFCPGKRAADTTYNILEVVADPEYFAVYIRPWLMRLVKFVSRAFIHQSGIERMCAKG